MLSLILKYQLRFSLHATNISRKNVPLLPAKFCKVPKKNDLGFSSVSSIAISCIPSLQSTYLIRWVSISLTELLHRYFCPSHPPMRSVTHVALFRVAAAATFGLVQTITHYQHSSGQSFWWLLQIFIFLFQDHRIKHFCILENNP